MKFEAGKYYRTRDNSKAHILLIEDGRIFGRVRFHEGQWIACAWYSNGQKRNDPTVDDLDLMEVWKEPEPISGFVNQYENGRLEVFRTRLIAEKAARSSCVRTAVPVIETMLTLDGGFLLNPTQAART